ncbi:MAG: universal stress protein [Cyclobacteriaceae bacterium]
MKSILIPVDYSVYASAGIRAGIVLAKKTKAELYLLNVFNGPADWNKITVEEQQKHPEIETRMIEAEVKMDNLLKDKMFRGVKVTGVVRPGNIRDEIMHFAKLYKSDLIIMGAHGKGESRNYFIGSHAQKVLRTAPCPVLSVKSNFKAASVKRIVFAANFEESVSKLFSKIKSFVKVTGASVDLLFVNTPQNFTESLPMEKAMKKFIEAFPDVKMKAHIFNAKEVEKGIIQFAESRKAHLIAKVTHDRTKKAGYHFGITETLLYNSDIPVLSVMTN